MTSQEPPRQLISLRCVRSGPGTSSEWHSHEFEELCLTTDDATTNGFADGKIAAAPDTLFLFRRGERHGYWNDARQQPRFWVVHFQAGPELASALDTLRIDDARQRIWSLSPDRAESFKFLFLKLLNEQAAKRPRHGLAEAAWLQLLLVAVQRWARREPAAGFAPEVADPSLLQLWHVVNECVGRPAAFRRRIADVPNYDSLRHRFKKEFGCSPGQMLLRLRLEQAKSLLLETPLSVKQIAAQAGYLRQHEFARAFRRHAGASPTQWRRSPTAAAEAGART